MCSLSEQLFSSSTLHSGNGKQILVGQLTVLAAHAFCVLPPQKPYSPQDPWLRAVMPEVEWRISEYLLESVCLGQT